MLLGIVINIINCDVGKTKHACGSSGVRTDTAQAGTVFRNTRYVPGRPSSKPVSLGENSTNQICTDLNTRTYVGWRSKQSTVVSPEEKIRMTKENGSEAGRAVGRRPAEMEV